VFILLIAFNYLGFAQIDKENFEKIFDQELNDSKYTPRENHSSKYLHCTPQEVPVWILNPPASDNQGIIALGISDPGMDSTDGWNQALLRAQIMANIFRKNTTQLLCDFFLNEQNNTQQVVYEHYSRIVTYLPDSLSQFEILNSFKNNYDETFVLIRYTPPTQINPSMLKTVFLELYRNEVENSIYGNFESVYELLVKDSNKSNTHFLSYQFTEYGPRSSADGYYNHQDYIIPIYSLNYKLVLNQSEESLQLAHGFWPAYLKSTINTILAIAKQKPENIKVMGDKYQTNSYEKLTRGLSENKLSFRFTGLTIADKSLEIKLDEFPVE